MLITQDGYNSEERNLGGAGKILVDAGAEGTCRLEPISIAYLADGSSYLSLGGFQIGTATYEGDRALWVFTPTMSADTLEETCWEGVKFEIMSDTNYKAFCSYNLSYSKQNLASGNQICLGGGRVSLGPTGRILVVDKGTPEETKEAVIGSTRVTLGRFGSFWAIAVYSRFTSCEENAIDPQAPQSLIVKNSAAYDRTVLTTTFDPQIPCPSGIQVWLYNTTSDENSGVVFELSTDGGETWSVIYPRSSTSNTIITVEPGKIFGVDILYTVSPSSLYFEGSERENYWANPLEMQPTIFLALKNLSDNTIVQNITITLDSI